VAATPADAAPADRPAGSHRIRVGCSGWNYRHWRAGVFYPDRLPAGRWLEHYASRFDTVELNTTFYRLPTQRSAQRWVDQTPDEFVFAVKVSRFATHVRRLRTAGKDLETLVDHLTPLVRAGKLGPLLWQLPPTFRRDDERLEHALQELPASLRHAFEFRHESWFVPEVLECLASHGVALVIADRPEIQAFQTNDLTSDFVFLRFHHGSRGRCGNYSSTELDDWAARIRRWSSERDVYAYFNNDWEGFAPANAAAVRDKVSNRPATERP
jgi:uncharacterized protein YecE (DUF72 family)